MLSNTIMRNLKPFAKAIYSIASFSTQQFKITFEDGITKTIFLLKGEFCSFDVKTVLNDAFHQLPHPEIAATTEVLGKSFHEHVDEN